MKRFKEIKEKEPLNHLVKQALMGIHVHYYSHPLDERAAQRDNERPGYLIITHYNPQEVSHAGNIVNGVKHQLVNSTFPLQGSGVRSLLEKLTHQDGAILLGKKQGKGKVYRVGARLKN